jgi:hypothetical protein
MGRWSSYGNRNRLLNPDRYGGFTIAVSGLRASVLSGYVLKKRLSVAPIISTENPDGLSQHERFSQCDECRDAGD